METDRSDQYDDWREQHIRREWQVDGEPPPACKHCGHALTWTPRGFVHLMPRKLAAPTGSAVGEIARGFDLYDWIERTGGHAAVLR